MARAGWDESWNFAASDGAGDERWKNESVDEDGDDQEQPAQTIYSLISSRAAVTSSGIEFLRSEDESRINPG